VGPSAGPDARGKTRLHRDSIPDRLARSESLYRLSYPDPRTFFPFNLLASKFFFLILAHPVYKMLIIQEPNTLEL